MLTYHLVKCKRWNILLLYQCKNVFKNSLDFIIYDVKKNTYLNKCAPGGLAVVMKQAVVSCTPLGSWRRIRGRPRWHCPPGSAHSRRPGRVVAWTRGRCGWYHRVHTGANTNTHSGTLHSLETTVPSTHFWIPRTTLGMKGGSTFLARRSSQSMEAKKGCSCSSSCKHLNIRSSVLVLVSQFVSLFQAVHLRGHSSPLCVWWSPGPASPPTVSGPPETPRCPAAEERRVCSRTSLLCCGCRMEAERQNRESEGKMLRKDNDEREERDCFPFTHQSIEHLKKHSAQSPPVHCWTVGVAL